MYSRMIALDTRGRPDDQLWRMVRFVTDDLAMDSQGTLPGYMKAAQLDQTTPLRLMLGIPEHELTPKVQRFAEAMFRLCFMAPDQPSREMWTDIPELAIANPNGAGSTDAGQLDTAFMTSFGFGAKLWSQVLGYSSGEVSKFMSGQITDRGKYKKLWFAFYMAGFSKPDHFFTQ